VTARYRFEALVEETGLDEGVLFQVIERRLVTVRPADELTIELDQAQLARLRLIRRLVEDFDLNIDALELVLDLRDELAQTR
jgi:hypothetical protein